MSQPKSGYDVQGNLRIQYLIIKPLPRTGERLTEEAMCVSAAQRPTFRVANSNFVKGEITFLKRKNTSGRFQLAWIFVGSFLSKISIYS